jgi:flagellin
MSVVNTNVSASISQAALSKNERAMQKAMEQLSTGSKINSAKDDAAGLAMASKFTAQIKGLDMAVKNANDAISMISTAEGAMTEVTSMLQRMRELAVQSSNGTVTAEDRGYMDLEYQALDDEINRIGLNTQWNGENVLDGSAGAQGGNSASNPSLVTFLISANYSEVTHGSPEVPYQAATQYGSSDVLSGMVDSNGDAVAALYSDGGTAQTKAADTSFNTADLNTDLGVANLQTDGADDNSAAATFTLTESILLSDLGVSALYDDGATASDGRDLRKFTADDILGSANTNGVVALYTDGTVDGTAGGSLLTADNTLTEWSDAVTAFETRSATANDNYTFSGEIITKFDAAVAADGTATLGDTDLTAFAATNTKLTSTDTVADWYTAIDAYDALVGDTALHTLADAQTALEAQNAADDTVALNTVVANATGTALDDNSTLAEWDAAITAYDANNGTSIRDSLSSAFTDALAADSSATLGATVETVGANTNTLLGDTSTLADWKAAIDLFDAAEGVTSTLSDAFSHPLASETDQLGSVEKSAEVAFQEGSGTFLIESYDTVEVDFGDLANDMAAVRVSNVASQETAQAAINSLDAGIAAISGRRAAFGAAANRLEYAVANLTNIQNNAEASRSRIMDTDYAETTSELAKAQIIAQAGTAMLAQANQLPQNILTLLK